MLLAAIRLLNIVPGEALEAAIRRGRRADVVEENLAALAHSKDLASVAVYEPAAMSRQGLSFGPNNFVSS